MSSLRGRAEVIITSLMKIVYPLKYLAMHTLVVKTMALAVRMQFI